MLRLLGDLESSLALKVGRTPRSTVDTYWLVISGADQVERLLELVQAPVSRGGRPGARDDEAHRPDRLPTPRQRRWARVVDVKSQPLLRLRVLPRGSADAHLRHDGRACRAQLLPEGLARAQAARRELRLPLPAPELRHRGERAAEAARDREAAAGARHAAREGRRAARARVQAQHRRHARGAEPRARRPPHRGGSRRARLGSRRRRASACCPRRRSTRIRWRRSTAPTRRCS